MGRVRLTGALSTGPSSDSLIVIVHGLGANAEAQYMVTAARAAQALGAASLRLNLRGADGSGEDFYHAGLHRDIELVIGSGEVSKFPNLYILGFSVGGHVCLSWAAFGGHPRVRAVCAICPPLDLDQNVRAMDAFYAYPYRRHILLGLKPAYAAVARRRPVPLPWSQARGISKIREWDERIVAPRWGFSSARHYYREVSAGPKLGHITTPTLIVTARYDPMIPDGTLRESLRGRSEAVRVESLVRGGHVSFPADIHLGVRSAPRGLANQAVGWLLARATA
ncbi:MAG TPA: alpha/beta fold hydrolase [Polyangiaceae bacterium]|jgi:hypothetical protein